MIIRIPESTGTYYERILYPAGELQVRLLPTAIRQLYETDSVQVLCRNAHTNLMELALLSDAIHHLRGFIDSTLVLPYLPYSRADRRFLSEGDCHGLKTFSEILNGLHYNRIRTLDVHSFRAAKNVGNLVDVSARPFISRAIADICDYGGHPIVLLPDDGAQRYDLKSALQCHKKRDAATGKLSGFEVPKFDKSEALIVDDICDGGGTFIGLAKALQEQCRIGCHCPGLPHQCGVVQPFKKLYLYVTHGIFSKGLDELFKHFEKIYTTDSVYPAGLDRTAWQNKLEVYGCESELLKEKTGGQ